MRIGAESDAFPVFEAVFKEFGLPKAIRTDNGFPSQAPMRSSASVSWRSGGSGSASRSNASSPVTRSRTDATNPHINS
jgi:hypothetical protein